MSQTQGAFSHPGLHYQAGENAELHTLYFRLLRLLKLSLKPIFVFDGPSRPSVKCSKHVLTAAHWLTTGFKQLITAFGFDHHTVRAVSTPTITEHSEYVAGPG